MDRIRNKMLEMSISINHIDKHTDKYIIGLYSIYFLMIISFTKVSNNDLQIMNI